MNIKNLLKELANKNVIIFFSTHILEFAEELSDAIIILNYGQIVFESENKELKDKNKKLKNIFFNQGGFYD